MKSKTRKNHFWKRFLKILLILLAGCLLYKIIIITYKINYLRTHNPRITSLIQYRINENKKRGIPYKYVIKFKPYKLISRNLKYAILSAEDPNFFKHHGIDFTQLKESFIIDLKQMRYARGASTITMQTTRTLFLSPEKTIRRKAKELFITLIMELLLPKERIFELYLNYAELGPGIFGVEAACNYYFHKSSSKLTVYEAISIAAAIPSPTNFNPAKPDAKLLRRIRIIYNKFKLLKSMNPNIVNLLPVNRNISYCV